MVCLSSWGTSMLLNDQLPTRKPSAVKAFQLRPWRRRLWDDIQAAPAQEYAAVHFLGSENLHCLGFQTPRSGLVRILGLERLGHRLTYIVIIKVEIEAPYVIVSTWLLLLQCDCLDNMGSYRWNLLMKHTCGWKGQKVCSYKKWCTFFAFDVDHNHTTNACYVPRSPNHTVHVFQQYILAVLGSPSCQLYLLSLVFN